MQFTETHYEQLARENRIHGAVHALKRKGWRCSFNEASLQVTISKVESASLQTYDWNVSGLSDYKNFLDFVCATCNPRLWAIRQRARAAEG